MPNPRLFIPSLLLCLAMVVACPAAQRWRFIVTCDSRGDGATGLNEPVLSEIAHEIVRQEADLLIYPGDLVYGAHIGPERFESLLWDWIRIMKPVYEAGIPVYVCRGNHEVGDMWYAEPNELPDPNDNYSLRWLNVFGNENHPDLKLPDNGPSDAKHMSYAVVHKNVLILAVDQYGGTRHWLAHQVDQAWVDSVLRSNTQPHVFVFGHEPAFRVVHADCLDDHPSQRDAFWHSLEAADARMYFCGHDHFYNHAWVDDGDGDLGNDVHQLVVATAGAPGYTWAPPYVGDNGPFEVVPVHHAERHGYLLAEINGPHVTTTWMERQASEPWRPGVYRPKYAWGYEVAARRSADLNGDGMVDFADLAILASQWLAPVGN